MTMTEDDHRTHRVIGQRLLRKEDPALLTGEAKFTNDLDVPGRAPPRRAAQPVRQRPIVSIDTSAAAAMPGVVAVYTGADLADQWAAPMPCAWPVTERHEEPGRTTRSPSTRSATSATAWRCVLADTDAIAPRRDRGDRRRVRARASRSSTSRTPSPTAWWSTTTSAPTRRTRGTSTSRGPTARSSRRSPTPRTRSASATSSSG